MSDKKLREVHSMLLQVTRDRLQSMENGLSEFKPRSHAAIEMRGAIRELRLFLKTERILSRGYDRLKRKEAA